MIEVYLMVTWYIASTAGHRKVGSLIEALKTAKTLRKLGHRVKIGGYASDSDEIPAYPTNRF